MVTAPGGGNPQEYHSLLVPDYVTVLAVTSDGKVPLVRQYRPALENSSLELPGGLAEEGESLDVTATRELSEETGYTASELLCLGWLHADSGRLENRLWCYFAASVKQLPEGSWNPEEGVEVITVDQGRLFNIIKEGEFKQGLHVAAIGLAMMHGLLPPT